MAAPISSPLPDTKHTLLDNLVDGLDASALHWLSGYMAGAAAQLRTAGKAANAPMAAPAAAARQRLTIIYGSQTGNAKRVAEDLARRAQAQGLTVRLSRADAYPQRELKDERLLYVVMSTQGEGEPPDDSRGLVEFLSGRRAPKLENLKFAVLGLGDSSYPKFCGISHDLDARLAALGATRLQEAGACDLDVDTVAAPWTGRALEQARDILRQDAAPLASVTPLRPARAVAFHRDAPYEAEVLSSERLTARDSTKDIRHLELALAGSGLRYAPGDALGVWPRQSDALLRQILDTTRLDGESAVTVDGKTLTLATWLTERRELTRLARPFVAAQAERSGDARLQQVLLPENRERLGALFDSHQVIDLLREFPADWSAPALLAALRPLAPRLYSIASSPEDVGEDVHLTVANIAYSAFGETRWGAASHYLSGLREGDRARVFIEENERFHLPADPARDVIMVGPGTGVAPFRAFVQHRAATAAAGRNWLFFGNPRFTSDFLYQVEWQQAVKDGKLQRLDLAFSRDQEEKIYVQQRMREQGRELYSWLQDGAHLYVCGDAAQMAKDVHAALLDIAREHGGKQGEAAEQWLAELAAQGRYARDVY